MAHNRMLLVYRPTGKSIVLAKRGSFGWSNSDDLGVRFAKLMEEVERACNENDQISQDDFYLAMEQAEGLEGVLSDWNYTKEDTEFGELIQLIIKDTIPHAKPTTF
jgi:hypothetical protein